jgi:hypothetical protein
MKASVRTPSSVPILVERAADYFGNAGQVFVIRAQLPANGTLTLTEDRLVFEPEDARTTVEIPLAEIRSLGMGRWHEPTGTFVPVLKVRYRHNLVFGVHVSHPERWIEAVESLATRNHYPELRAAGASPHRLPRGLRLLVALVLILVIVASALPAFLTRLGPRVPHHLAGSTASAPVTR